MYALKVSSRIGELFQSDHQSVLTLKVVSIFLKTSVKSYYQTCDLYQKLYLRAKCIACRDVV